LYRQPAKKAGFITSKMEKPMKHTISVTVNGTSHCLVVDSGRTLNEMLREDLNLTGTKLGCGTGDCGACTVLMDGRSVNSCLTLAAEVDGRNITTVEGLAVSGEELHPIQDAFIEKGAIQCGYCTAGMEMSALQLLSNNPTPSEKEIRNALSGNLCRCTGYTKIVDAIRHAAGTMSGKTTEGGAS
jgi:carbon-monoxide dehydrogenase small subunit